MPARRKEADFTSDAREHPSRAVERPKPQDHSLHARITEVTRADPSRRREQPTSGLYSVDESVVSIAVASESTPDPSMGFVPLQGPLALRSSLVHARTGERRRAEARDALDAGPVFEADASTVGIPPTIAPRNLRRPHPRVETMQRNETSPGAEADSERRAFSARRPKPGTAPRIPWCGRSRPRERGSVAGVYPEARS